MLLTFAVQASKQQKKIDFLKKNIKKVLKSWNGLNWILHYKRALKSVVFADLMFLTCGV